MWVYNRNGRVNGVIGHKTAKQHLAKYDVMDHLHFRAVSLCSQASVWPPRAEFEPGPNRPLEKISSSGDSGFLPLAVRCKTDRSQ